MYICYTYNVTWNTTYITYNTSHHIQQLCSKLEAVYEFYCTLRECGITKNANKNEKVDNVLEQLLELFQEQWRLLNETSDVLQDVANQCKASHSAIYLWKIEGKKAENKTIENGINKLKEWILHKDKIAVLSTKWQKFREKIEKFQLKWDDAKGDVERAIQASAEANKQIKNSLESTNQKLKKKAVIFGGGFTVGAILTVCADLLLPVIIVSVGLLGAVGIGCAIVAGGICGLYLYKRAKIKKQSNELDAQVKKMNESVEAMQDEIDKMLKEAKLIQVQCNQLRKQMKDSSTIADVLETYGNNEKMWDVIKPELETLDKSLLSFEKDCRLIVDKITKAQVEIASK